MLFSFTFTSDCHEWLCEGCEKAHKRVRMTKEHALLPLPDAEDFLEREKKKSASEGGGETGTGEDSTGEAAGNNRGVYCKVSCWTIGVLVLLIMDD